MNTAGLIPETDRELREANMELVRKYVEMLGWEKTERYPLYSDDHRGGLYSTITGIPPVFTGGKEAKVEFDNRITLLYPDWAHSDLEIYQTEDPSVFLATGKGFGYVVAPKYDYPYYENFFIHYFKCENGKITDYQENMNPCVMFNYFKVPVPVIKRPPRNRDYIDAKHVEGL